MVGVINYRGYEIRAVAEGYGIFDQGGRAQGPYAAVDTLDEAIEGIDAQIAEDNHDPMCGLEGQLCPTCKERS
jgi:hypothetical protein